VLTPSDNSRRDAQRSPRRRPPKQRVLHRVLSQFAPDRAALYQFLLRRRHCRYSVNLRIECLHNYLPSTNEGTLCPTSSSATLWLTKLLLINL
jgi:hypothetical protein